MVLDDAPRQLPLAVLPYYKVQPHARRVQLFANESPCLVIWKMLVAEPIALSGFHSGVQ